VARILVFNNVTADGFIADCSGHMSWARKEDEEWKAFINGNASGGGTLLFGRVTYEMMASFWPTKMAADSMPIVAEHMNSVPKVVFSKTLNTAEWSNTTLLKGDLSAEVRRLKVSVEGHIVIFGSGSIVAQLTQARLIDQYDLIVHPVLLGAGKSMFTRLDTMLDLKLIKSRTFGNGNVLLSYETQGSTS
jgi:dihydrofolate reductase